MHFFNPITIALYMILLHNNFGHQFYWIQFTTRCHPQSRLLKAFFANVLSDLWAKILHH